MKEALYKLGEVVHALQKERGSASMFLSSDGKLFSRRMNAQFDECDRTIKVFAEGFDRWSASGRLKVAQRVQLQELINRYETLPELRKTINAQEVSISNTIDHYAHQLIGPLIQVMVEIALFMDGHNSTFVSGYSAFLQWKERIGLERAISVRGFVNYSFHNTEFLERILFLLSEQSNYRNTYMALASSEQTQLVQNVLNGAACTRLESLHDALKQSPGSAELYELTPEAWFDLITAKIDALQAVEKKLVNTLSTKGESVPEAGHANVIVNEQLISQNTKGGFGEYDKLIRSLRLFAGISDKNLQSLIEHGQIRKFHKGKLLFLAGEQANRLYIILKGWVKIFKGTSSGEETILQMLSSGDAIMESAVFLNTTFPVNAQIAEDAVLLSIPAPMIRNQVKNNNELALNLLASMSYRSQGLIRQIEDDRLKSVDERIGWFLLKLLLQQGRISREVKLPYDKALIASHLDMKRETFSRSLKRLKAKDYKIENHSVVVPNLLSLCEFCDADTECMCSLYDKPDCPKTKSSIKNL